jgi:hypothetical protein
MFKIIPLRGGIGTLTLLGRISSMLIDSWIEVCASCPLRNIGGL